MPKKKRASGGAEIRAHAQELERALAEITNDSRIILQAGLRQHALHEGEQGLGLARHIVGLERAAGRRFGQRALVVALVVGEDLLHLAGDLRVLRGRAHADRAEEATQVLTGALLVLELAVVDA